MHDIVSGAPDSGAPGSETPGSETAEGPIYLDHAATTPVDPRVLDAMLPLLGCRFGNPGSRLYGRGLEAEAALEHARREVAALLGARPVEITFTGGATESNNLALQGLIAGWAYEAKLIVSAIEHPAILQTARFLADRGVDLEILPVDGDGRLRLDELEQALRHARANHPGRPILVSVMHANNETGTLQPVEEIGVLCRAHGAVFHCDASQSVGKIRVDVRTLGADLLSLSSHKFYGPMGVGALYVRRQKPRLPIEPLIFGGGQERGLRPGTQNLPGIVGLGEAAAVARRQLEEEGSRLQRLTETLLSSLREGLDGVHVNGSIDHRLPGSINLSFDGVKAQDLQRSVQPDLEISSGSACATGTVGPSHVIRALGLPAARAEGAVRLAIGRFTRESEIRRAADLLIAGVRSRRASLLH